MEALFLAISEFAMGAQHDLQMARQVFLAEQVGNTAGAGTLISDAYSLSVVTPPQAPYAGSFNGPGALLNDAPNRTTAAETVLITGQRTLDAQVYALRAGPYYEHAFGKRWSGRGPIWREAWLLRIITLSPLRTAHACFERPARSPQSGS